MIWYSRLILLAVIVTLVTACSQEVSEPAPDPRAEASPALSDVGANSRAFSVASADGTQITGQVDVPFGTYENRPVVVLSAATGLFDRDERLGTTGTERDAIFADLSRRFTQAGVAVVRYDRRGFRYRPVGGQKLDKAVSGTSTVETQRDDLGAVYDLARVEFGGPRACVALLGHSEGLQHIAGLAAADAVPPNLVVGIGGPLQAPADVFRWQVSERDGFSLRMLDADGDGVTTNDEVMAGLSGAPSAVFGNPQPYLHPLGQWTQQAIARKVAGQKANYLVAKVQALAMSPTAPYPDTKTPMAQYSWWQNWYTDDVPVAEKLAAWDTPMLLYYGDRDSQVRYEFQLPVAAEFLGSRAEVHVLPGLGHSLGPHVLLGPMEDAAADALVARTAAILNERCAS